MNAPTTEHHQKMIDRVAKLLRQAEDAELGDRQAEADAFQEKAFQIMADYGISEALARARRDGLDITEEAKATSITARFVGSYQHAQLYLFWDICGALHCQAIKLNGTGKQVVMRVYGMPDHLKRLQDMWVLITPQAQHGMATAHPGPGASSADVTTFRRSWLEGFSDQICARIVKAEDAAAAAAGELVLYKSDKERAEEAMRSDFPHLTVYLSSCGIDSDGYASGGAAASTAQLHRSVTR
jgi:hypothetical protein